MYMYINQNVQYTFTDFQWFKSNSIRINASCNPNNKFGILCGIVLLLCIISFAIIAEDRKMSARFLFHHGFSSKI